MHSGVMEITKLISDAGVRARRETGDELDATVVTSVKWPVDCTVGPGLEGAIACESKVGYVNGSRGMLSYRGYDIFDLCANATFEEVSYLLLNGELPTAGQLASYKERIVEHMNVQDTLKRMMTLNVEDMHSMAALRLGVNVMRHRQTNLDTESGKPDARDAIGQDEDSIPMETAPMGEQRAIYEFRKRKVPKGNLESGYKVIAGVTSLAAAIARLRAGQLPLEPDPSLGHSANFLYMMTGEKPSREQEKIMDVLLILQADHGINASTFASLVVASTLSDIYSSISAGIGALTGPLHGGANEEVVHMLRQIGSPDNVERWYQRTRKSKTKIMGVGHRVYKVYDPRARVLAPIARYLAKNDPETGRLFRIARKLEKEIHSTLGKKGLFPNVDYYSGMVYGALGIDESMFTPIFAVSRVAGWTARILEYLSSNRIFRPRVMYSGPVDREFVPMRSRQTRSRK